MTLHPINPNFLIYEENFIFIFIQCWNYLFEIWQSCNTDRLLTFCNRLSYWSNMELDKQSYFGSRVQLYCTHWLRAWDPATATPPPPHLGSYTRALLVSQDRQLLFVTPWFKSSVIKKNGIFDQLLHRYRVQNHMIKIPGKKCNKNILIK